MTPKQAAKKKHQFKKRAAEMATEKEPTEEEKNAAATAHDAETLRRHKLAKETGNSIASVPIEEEKESE